MERNRVFAVEGLDGTGKTTAAKLIAEETSSQYYYCSDRNSLKAFRKRFDNAPSSLRFMYYTAFALDTYFRAESMRNNSDVYVDRTVLATIAYHKAMGLSNGWFKLVPKFMINQIDMMLYFTADENTRTQLLNQRAEALGTPMTRSDSASLNLALRIDDEFRKIIPERTLIVPSLSMTNPRLVVDFVKGALYEAR